MRYFVVLLTIFFASHAAAQEAACPATNAEELHAIFASADAREVATCAAATAGMLVDTPDADLARELFELASGDAAAAADTLPFSLALVFAAQPGVFATTLDEIPAATRCGVLDSVALGLSSVKREDYAQEPHKREASLGELRQAHSCQAHPQEATSPSTKPPDRYVPRSRRPRWANVMTPVVVEERAYPT